MPKVVQLHFSASFPGGPHIVGGGGGGGGGGFFAS